MATEQSEYLHNLIHSDDELKEYVEHLRGLLYAEQHGKNAEKWNELLTENELLKALIRSERDWMRERLPLMEQYGA